MPFTELLHIFTFEVEPILIQSFWEAGPSEDIKFCLNIEVLPLTES